MHTVYPQGPFAVPLLLPAVVGGVQTQTFTVSGLDLGNVSYLNFVIFTDAAGTPTRPKVELAYNNDPANFTTVTSDAPLNTNFSSGGFRVDVDLSLRTVGVLGVYRLRLRQHNLSFLLAGTAWTIRFTNSDAFANNITFVVADSDFVTPWLHVPSSVIDFGAGILPGETDGVTVGGRLFTDVRQLLTGSTYDVKVRLRNYGTGTFNLSLPSGVSGPFTMLAKMLAIAPGGSDDVTVELLSLVPGVERTRSFDIGAADAEAHPNTVFVSATTGRLEMVFLLDASGSMAWTPEGHPLGTPGDQNITRWAQLAGSLTQVLTAVGQFAGPHSKYAVALFPAVPGTTPVPGLNAAVIAGPADIVNPIPFPLTGAHQPTNGTPMGDGVEAAMGLRGDATSFGLFNSAPAEVAKNHRWLVLMTDGAHNSAQNSPPDTVASHDPSNLSAFPAAYYATDQKNVKVITVGYGTPGSSDVNWPLLQDVAANSGGIAFHADVSGPAGDLTTQLKKAVTHGLGLQFASDPDGVLPAGQAEVRHTAIVTELDARVSFDVYTGTAPEGRVLHVELITPNGERVTPEGAAGLGIEWVSGDFFQSYFVPEAALRDDRDPGGARYGTWTIVVSRAVQDVDVPRAGEGEEEAVNEGEPPLRYAYQVITDSRLRFAVSTLEPAHHAGDPIEVAALLAVGGRPIRDAWVTARLTAPGDAFDNWLAAQEVTEEEYRAAAEKLGGVADVHALLVKRLALEARGVTFPGADRSDVQTLQYDPGAGVYRTTFAATRVPGNYRLDLAAIGQDKKRNLYRRERALHTRVDVLADPDASLIDVGYQQVHDQIHATVRVWPRDRFGNVVLVDPTLSAVVQVTARGAAVSGPLAGNLDGSYVQRLTYPSGTAPTIGIRVKGHDLVRGYELLDLHDMLFVDEVLELRLGDEAAPGANQHTDPAQALGDVTRKGAGELLSLGALGSGAFAVAGCVVTAREVTVFVAPDADLRPYAVEVLPARFGADWVPIGFSAGVTRTFSLLPRRRRGEGGKKGAILEIEGSLLGASFDLEIDLQSRLRGARDWLDKLGPKGIKAIRVVDRSGRIQNRDGSPAATPGVSLRGIGFTR
jgi:hypothetical protein